MYTDSKGRPIKIRLLDIGHFFRVNNNGVVLLPKKIPLDFPDLAPEIRAVAQNKMSSIGVNAEKLAVRNFGYELACLISQHRGTVDLIGLSSLHKNGRFDRKTFEQEIIDTAKEKGIPPLDLNNTKVINIIDLIQTLLAINPDDRPSFNEVFESLNSLKQGEPVSPCIIPLFIEVDSRRTLSSDREYVVDERQVMGKLKAFFDQSKQD